jgi:hypothetical protein
VPDRRGRGLRKFTLISPEIEAVKEAVRPVDDLSRETPRGLNSFNEIAQRLGYW